MAQFSDVLLQQCSRIMKSYNLRENQNIQCEDDLWRKLKEGLLIDGNKYFRLDHEARLCVDLYAKALSITWGEDRRYWTHDEEKIPNTDYTVKIAKLLQVCWLEVVGEFDMRKLIVGTEYEIFFDIELTAGAQRWDCPVTFEHYNPFGEMINKFEKNFKNKIGTYQISMGKFRVPVMPPTAPYSFFRMLLTSPDWKTGLIVRRLFIKPAN